jgi:hypothetical protein
MRVISRAFTLSGQTPDWEEETNEEEMDQSERRRAREGERGEKGEARRRLEMDSE